MCTMVSIDVFFKKKTNIAIDSKSRSLRPCTLFRTYNKLFLGIINRK